MKIPLNFTIHQIYLHSLTHSLHYAVGNDINFSCKFGNTEKNMHIVDLWNTANKYWHPPLHNTGHFTQVQLVTFNV